MYFREIGQNRYRVYKNKDDDKFYGTVEKQEFVSINIDTGKRVTKHFWQMDNATYGGWRETSAKKQFATREAAAICLLKEAAQPYGKKKTRWTTKVVKGGV